MWLIRAALRRPISVIVLVVALALTSILALLRTRIDIFPELDLPVIYVAQPYGGMSPQQMEGFLAYYYEYHFLYINGIENVEAKTIQGTALLRLTFHPGTDMSQALAQTISYVNRARAFMPPGTVSPFVIRYDAGTLPVGYLVFNSASRTLGEIQDFALNRVRPVFATLPGVSSPPPFGGNQRTIVINVDPAKLQAYGLSPENVVQALISGNSIEPAGNANIGDYQMLVTTDSTVQQITGLLDIPLHTGSGPGVYLRDVGSVSDSSDILAGYAVLNGKRTIYIPVTKRPDASTITVVNEVRNSLPRFQSLIPEDIKISYELDQSVYVREALSSVLHEGLLGALLTGLTILFFLRDWRSSLIVVITIPFALLCAVVALWATGQTINIMTLGGLALAVGVLVDEGTVLMENIHVHLAKGESKAHAILNASREVAIPRLLAMLCVLAVFLPSFFMTGPAKSLFLPLALAVGFSMGASYLLSSSLVPVRRSRQARHALLSGRTQARWHGRWSGRWRAQARRDSGPTFHRAAWSQATARLLVFTQAPNNAADLGPSGAAWLVDAATPDQRARFDAVPATAQGGAFTHDGDAIVFAAQTPEDAPPGYDELFNLSLAPGAKPIRLTAGFAGQVNAADLQFPSESTVVAEAEVGTRTTPVLISRDAGRPPDAINLNSSVVTGLTTNRAQTGWLWLADSAGRTRQTLLRAASSRQLLNTPRRPILRPPTCSPLRRNWSAGAAACGGLAIEGLLYLPPDTGSAKVPLIVDVHGGPFGAWEDRNDPFAAFLVGHGWAVLRPNPRGSSNYGVKFAAANKNDLGGGDYRDVMAVLYACSGALRSSPRSELKILNPCGHLVSGTDNTPVTCGRHHRDPHR